MGASLFWEDATTESSVESAGDEAGHQHSAKQQHNQRALEQRSLVVLRRWSNSVYFTCNQVRTVLSKYKFVPTSAEAFVIVYRRTIDWHGLASILFDLPPAVGELLRRRLGAANLVPPPMSIAYLASGSPSISKAQRFLFRRRISPVKMRRKA